MDLEDLLHTPVFDIENEQFLGYVIGTVVDPDRRRLLGIVTRTRFARPKMVAPAESVQLLHHDGAVVSKAGFRWLPLQRKIWRAWRRQRRGGQLTAVCKGETVGVVFDYGVAEDGRIRSLLVQQGMLGKSVRVKRDKLTKVEDGIAHLASDALASKKAKKSPPRGVPSAGAIVDDAAAMLGKTLAKASHTVRSGARAGLVGKPAPWQIKDHAGTVIVEEGRPLTAEALAAEAARGRTGELTGAVAGGALGRSLAKRRKKREA